MIMSTVRAAKELVGHLSQQAQRRMESLQGGMRSIEKSRDELVEFFKTSSSEVPRQVVAILETSISKIKSAQKATEAAKSELEKCQKML